MRKLVFALFVICNLQACKKSSDNNNPGTPTGNYIKVDDDTRQLGDIPSSDVSWTEISYPDGPYLNLVINNKAVNIDNSQNLYLSMSISLFEGSAATTDYKIENASNPSPSSAKVFITLQGGNDATMVGKSGTLHVTRDADNKIKSVKFENVQMYGTYEATVSCNVGTK